MSSICQGFILTQQLGSKLEWSKKGKQGDIHLGTDEGERRCNL
jgi:hypothetical protein